MYFHTVNFSPMPMIPAPAAVDAQLGHPAAGGRPPASSRENPEKPAGGAPIEWKHTDDWVHREQHKRGYEPKPGGPETLGENLTFTLTLPDSVHTAIWLLPLVDGRLWYGEVAKGKPGEEWYDKRTGRTWPNGKPDHTNTLFADWYLHAVHIYLSNDLRALDVYLHLRIDVCYLTYMSHTKASSRYHHPYTMTPLLLAGMFPIS